MNGRRMLLTDLLAAVRPGSQDWSWHDEGVDLWSREPELMRALVDDIRANGQGKPVLVGDDGRLWDGHHRVVALDSLGDRWILVLHWADLTTEQEKDALVEKYAEDEEQWRAQVHGGAT